MKIFSENYWQNYNQSNDWKNTIDLKNKLIMYNYIL